MRGLIVIAKIPNRDMETMYFVDAATGNVSNQTDKCFVGCYKRSDKDTKELFYSLLRELVTQWLNGEIIDEIEIEE